MIKHCFIDLETTGVDPKRNAIIQIAGELWSGGACVLEFDHLVRPLDNKIIEPEALEINKRTRKEIGQFPSASTAYNALICGFNRWVAQFDRNDKMFFVGFFADFDYQFLRQWFLDLGDNYFGSWFWNPPIDIAQIAMYHLQEQRAQMPNFKLMTVARQLGITFDDSALHDAKADIVLTRKIWQELEEIANLKMRIGKNST